MPLPLASYTTFQGSPTVTPGDGLDTTSDNALLAGSGALTADDTLHTLKIAPSSTGQSLDLAGHQLILSGSGLLFTGAEDYSITGGSIRLNSGELEIQQFGTGKLTIDSQILTQYGTNGYTTLTKSGPGTLVLTASNGFGRSDRSDLGFNINGGTVNFNSLAALGTPMQVNLNGGSLQYAAGYTGDNGDITRRPLVPNGIVVIWAGGGTIDTNGNDVSYTAPLGRFGYFGQTSPAGFAKTGSGGTDVPTGGLTKTGDGALTLAAINNYSGPTVISGGVLVIGNQIGQGLIGYTDASGKVTLIGNNAAGLVAGQPISAATISGGASIDSLPGTTLSTITTQYGSSVQTNGTTAAFTPLAQTSQTNIDTTGTGDTVVVSTTGLVVGEFVTGTGIPANTYITAIDTGAGTVTLSNALSGSGTLTTTLTFATNVTGSIATASTSITVQDASKFVVGQIVTGTGIAPGTTITGISGNTLTLSQAASADNTNASLNFGGEYITATGLAVAGLANGGELSAIGMSTSVAENLVFNGGTLRYLGSGATTDRDFSVTTNGGNARRLRYRCAGLRPRPGCQHHTIATPGRWPAHAEPHRLQHRG